MATLTFASAFDSDSFWFASANFISNDGTVYRYETTAGFCIEVTGAGLTDDGSGNPTGGTYTQIKAFTDNTFSTEIASYTSATAFNFATYFTNAAFDGLSLNDTITGSSGNDTIAGKGGTDTLNGGEGGDVYQFSSQFGSDVVGNEIINDSGFSGSDFIQILGNATVIDFSSATVLNIEQLLFSDLQTAEFDQSQLPTNLIVTGAAATGQAIIVNMSTGTFTAGGWSFATWGVNDKVNIVGRVLGDDIITGSNQEDFITGQGGADSINGGESGDTYQYLSTSEASGDAINDSGTTGVDRLSLFGNVDFTGVSSIQHVEGVLFDGANTATFDASQFGAGLLSTAFEVTGVGGTSQTIVVQNASNFSAVSWNLNNWEQINVSELDTLSIIGTNGGDTLTGSNAHDVISGGLGADIIRGGIGGDTLDGGEGSDIYEYGASEVIPGETITDTGTIGKDTIRLLGDVSFLPVTTLTGIEAFVFTGDQDLQINSFPIFGVDFELTGSNGTAQSLK